MYRTRFALDPSVFRLDGSRRRPQGLHPLTGEPLRSGPDRYRRAALPRLRSRSTDCGWWAHTYISGLGAEEEQLHRVCEAMIEQVRACPFDVATVSTGGGLPIRHRAGDVEFNAQTYGAAW